MSELVERLRDHALFNKQDRCLMFIEAADRIEALEEQTQVLKQALIEQSGRINAIRAALRATLSELSACALQLNSTKGGSVFRAIELARAALAPETEK